MIIDKNNINIEHFINAPYIFGPLEGNGPSLRECRFKNLSYGLSLILDTGNILEFGVRHAGKGSTFKLISETLPNKTIHGFDSFIGLPEDWIINNGDDGAVAKANTQVTKDPVPTKNGRFWPGWFEDTIDQYLKEFPTEKIAFLHVDCDIYSSTRTIFDKLNHLIDKDTIIVFDELYPFGVRKYENWKEHEWKALVEWVSTYDRKFEVVSKSNHWQATIKVIE